jgi:UDP-glucose 4-epimerase
MAVPTFIERALAGDPIVVYGDGSQRRCFADVETFTNAVLAIAAEPGAWQSTTNVVNVGSQVETSIGDLARLVRSVTGSASDLVYQPYESVFPGRVDVRRRVPSTARLHLLIGTPSWPSIATTVEQIVQAAGPARAGGPGIR